jgi:hypothetical protein
MRKRPLLATEETEDELDREHGAPMFSIMLSLAPHKLTKGGDDNERSGDGDGLPKWSRAEIDQRIRVCEAELRCLQALRDGKHDEARKLNHEFGAADDELVKLIDGEKNGKR